DVLHPQLHVSRSRPGDDRTNTAVRGKRKESCCDCDANAWQPDGGIRESMGALYPVAWGKVGCHPGLSHAVGNREINTGILALRTGFGANRQRQARGGGK